MAHQDLDLLLNALIPFAQQQIGKRGTYLPFGAMLSNDGEIALVAVDYDHSRTIIGALTQLEEALRTESAAGNIRACGICIDMRMNQCEETSMPDAICAKLEHQNGEATDVYLPYKKGWFRKVKYGEVFGQSRERVIFR